MAKITAYISACAMICLKNISASLEMERVVCHHVLLLRARVMAASRFHTRERMSRSITLYSTKSKTMESKFIFKDKRCAIRYMIMTWRLILNVTRMLKLT